MPLQQVSLRIDYSLLLPVLLLLSIGVTAIYIAVSHDYQIMSLPDCWSASSLDFIRLSGGFIVMFF